MQKSGKSVADTTVAEETSLVVGDLDIDSLNDDELFTLLKENGINVGPIVGSTRYVGTIKRRRYKIKADIL